MTIYLLIYHPNKAVDDQRRHENQCATGRDVYFNGKCSMNRLPTIRTYDEVMKEIKKWILSMTKENQTMEILEAGCGGRWGLELGELKYKLTGIDLDRIALDRRLNVRKDLDEAMVGDLRTVDLGGRMFDVIYCSYVLEHVDGAEQVLSRFSKWLRPNGIAIIRVPDRDSVKGFITRMTPHWFHILYYKIVLKFPNAGKPGFPPYPTIYDPVISSYGMREFVEKNNLTLVQEYGTGGPQTGDGLLPMVIRMVMAAVAALSFGRFRNDNSDLLFILRRVA